MSGRKKTYIISGSIIVVLVTILSILAVQYILPNSMSIWKGESISSYGGIWSVEMTTEVQNQKTPETVGLDMDFTNRKGTLKLFGLIPVKQVNVEVWEHTELIPCGDIIGIDIATRGVMILGTGKIQTLTGEKESPARGKVYSGDLIQKIDDQTVKDIGDVQECLNSLTADPVIILLERDGQSVSVELKPIQDIHKEYRLGIWLRDREQGLGTLTYVNPETQEYGAVGHGITDVDTREIMSVGNGSITTATIVRVIPGSHGTPGEIQGSIGSSRLGNIELNLENGIYGEVYAESILSREAYPIALKNEVKEDEASILCSLDGSGPKEYDIHIRKNESMIASEDTFIVEITDAKLLEQTGGIIQGMSGSPIIQDGKLVGAVTHVLVNDPTRGYGIFIENMLDAAS